VAPTGPARFVQPQYDRFDKESAHQLTEFIDGFYRAPANEGYDAVVDRVVDELAAAGFEEGEGRLRWEIITGPPEPAWTPVSAELVLLADGEKPRTLHGFAEPGDVDRAMLPVNSPACDVEGDVALHLDQVKKGMILVTDVDASQVLRRAKARGAAAVISASLADFNEDTSGQERHLDAIQFRTLSVTNDMPVAQISRNTLLLIEAASQRAAVRKRKVRLSFKADVLREERPMRTLVATIVGAERPKEAFAMVSHIQELGACDNASGVAGLLEGARSLAELLEAEKLPWPQRSVVFIWGDEFRQSSTWLANTSRTPVAAISSDMTGQSKDTGAIALLERMPDPGALYTLPPDAHTPWGAGEVDSENLRPAGLAVIARCAMVDVGLIEGGNWKCADHPWEGGSDHDIFNEAGVPAVLFWHFTDFTYHTSLDRMDFLDPEEMRRTGVAILATALAVADPEPADLDRYLKSLAIEEQVRVAAAEDVENEELVALWRLWCLGARDWLRKECLGIDEDLPR
jgi:aminopeptidase YwaD